MRDANNLHGHLKRMTAPGLCCQKCSRNDIGGQAVNVSARLELPHELGSAAMHTVGGDENEAALRLQVVQFDAEAGHRLE